MQIETSRIKSQAKLRWLLGDSQGALPPMHKDLQRLVEGLGPASCNLCQVCAGLPGECKHSQPDLLTVYMSSRGDDDCSQGGGLAHRSPNLQLQTFPPLSTPHYATYRLQSQRRAVAFPWKHSPTNTQMCFWTQ